MKKLITILYVFVGMGLTIFFSVIIWNVTFGKIVEEYRTRQMTADLANKLKSGGIQAAPTFQESIIDSEERVKHYLGYRVLEQIRLEKHFHHVDFDFKPDKHSYCVDCHGDMPHDKVKEIRAFGNMHASFIGCQTCHVRLAPEKAGGFKWYDRTTGELVMSPIYSGVKPGAYQSKIIPLERESGNPRRIDTRERIAFAREYKKMESTLTDVQKSKAKKLIHNIVSEKPYLCENCHQKEAPLLPFDKLGYPTARMNSIIGTEVVGMIRNYTKFYIPNILTPGFGDREQKDTES